MGYDLLPDILATYFKNKYRLKVTLLGTNLLPDDGLIKRTRNTLDF